MHTAFSIISSLTNKCHVRCGYRLINQNFEWILTSVFNDYALSGKTHLENWKLLSPRLLLTKNTFLPNIFFQYEQYFLGTLPLVAVLLVEMLQYFLGNFSLVAVCLVWILHFLGEIFHSCCSSCLNIAILSNSQFNFLALLICEFPDETEIDQYSKSEYLKSADESVNSWTLLWNAEAAGMQGKDKVARNYWNWFLWLDFETDILICQILQILLQLTILGNPRLPKCTFVLNSKVVFLFEQERKF